MRINLILPFLLCLIFTQQNSYAQEESNVVRNILDNTTIWGELGGHGAAYSFGVEQILINRRNKLTLQISAAYYPKKTDIIRLWVPVTINHTIALEKSKNNLEIGLGLMLNDDGYYDIDGSYIKDYIINDLVARIGYRYRNPEKKWDLRIAFTPIFQDFSFNSPNGGVTFLWWERLDAEMIPWLGVGFGWRL